MAKTRIKNTPVRGQNIGQSPSGSNGVESKRIFRPIINVSGANGRQTLNGTSASSIIVAAPRRTNSISSGASSTSQASDNDNETANSVDTNPPTAPRSQKGYMSFTKCINPDTLKNRKVFMITEKSENGETIPNGSAGSQKRKMYLIMEDNANGGCDASNEAPKQLKTEQLPKRLTLFTDKTDGELSQKFGRILPEILSHIQQAKSFKQANDVVQVNGEDSIDEAEGDGDGDGDGDGTVSTEVLNESIEVREDFEDIEEERIPITLPPKKNRTKIISHQFGQNFEDSVAYDMNGDIIYPSSAATPVIVSPTSFMGGNPKNRHPLSKALFGPDEEDDDDEEDERMQPEHGQYPAAQKNINLSTDFLFLMKMLPKLESIPEPHKNHVKTCIEKIITQNATAFERQQ